MLYQTPILPLRSSLYQLLLFINPLLCLQVRFEIKVTANQCPEKGQRETIKIKPLGFTEEVEINLEFICECECHKEGIPDSPICHDGNGTFECGACRYLTFLSMFLKVTKEVRKWKGPKKTWKKIVKGKE